MANRASFTIGLDQARHLLQNVGLYKSRNVMKPHFANIVGFQKFSSEFIAVHKQEDYLRIYSTAKNNYDYDILLKDESIFQFSYDVEQTRGDENVILRYAFYHAPVIYYTYEDYIKEFSDDKDFIEYENEDQYYSSPEVKETLINFLPIRYDYDASKYCEITHPASHIHVGFNDSFRIPVKRDLTPGAFTSLVIRLFYENQFKGIVSSASRGLYFLKSYCHCLDTVLHSIEDEKDFYLF